MCQEQKYFNDIADKWDDIRLKNEEKIKLLITMTGIKEGDAVLDIGCGTGILLPFLKEALGDLGQITAIDFAASMIARAAAKYERLSGINYITGDINEYEPATFFDKIICLNFFPHASDKPAFIRKMKKMLKPGGSLVIMHDISRKKVNSIHKTSSAVKEDVLPDIKTVSQMLTEAGYLIVTAKENDELYFIKASIEK